MTQQKTKQSPISLFEAHKTDVRTQFAALCYRVVEDRTQILLITTRRSGRWIIPKGWPMDGKTPAECALIEAWEEAGAKGKSHSKSAGLYSYRKDLGTDTEMPCVAMIYPVKVTSLARKYPESGQRRRKWFSPRKAAEKVAETELAHILKSFDAKGWRG